MLQEAVSESDLYQLALNGALTLSVRFENDVSVRRVFVGSLGSPPSDLKNSESLQVLDFENDREYYAHGDHFYTREPLDLAMLAGEVDAIRKAEWHNGTTFVTHAWDSVLLKLPDGELVCPCDSEWDRESRVYEFTYWHMFPEGARIGIRVRELDALIGRLSGRTDAEPSEKESGRTTRDSTYLNIIAALLELVLTPRPGRDGQAAIIRELLENYGDKAGISKTTLETKFAEAKRSIAS